MAIRQLDQIQERNLGSDERERSRLSAMVLASFGGACIVFASLALMRSPDQPEVAPVDPLGDLIAQQADGSPGDTPEPRLSVSDVTFPGVLTDQDDPTTAMAAVRKRGRGAALVPAEPELPREPMMPYDGPPPATEQLPVVPLPAQDMLNTVPRPSVSPSDRLREVARGVAREPEPTQMSEPGQPGGYQLQVSSFKKPEDAKSFTLALRRRGHRAHTMAAHVQGRGLWHRVRIGPFKYRRSAEIYRQDFEAKERMATFVVDPPKTRIHVTPAE